jgi:hypothetical protein
VTLYGYDAAYPPTLDQLAAGSPSIIACYLTGNYAVPSGWPQQIRARGWSALANYEQAAGELTTCGRAGGQDVGRRAMAAALADGFPGACRCGTAGAVCESGIWFSVDVDVAQPAFGAVGAAFDGINDVIRPRFCAHVYGEGLLIDYLVATERVCRGDWLSASSGFPGYNQYSPNVGVYQMIGSPVPGTDQNTITRPSDLHVWRPSTPGGLLVSLTPAEEAEVLAAARVVNAEHGKFDLEASAVGNMLPAVAEMRPNVQAILAAVKAPAAGQPVDVAALATALSAHLGGDLAAALGAALTKGSTA